MPGPLQAAFHKRLRKAHGGPYLSIRDEPPTRPTTPRLGTDPYAKPKPKPSVKKHDTPRSPHKEHDPRYRQGVGQANARGRIQAELGGIFNGKNEGAGILDQPPKRGFNVSIAGDRRSIESKFRRVNDVDGVWEGELEQSYMAHAPRGANPDSVLRRAAAAGKENDQDAVFVRYDGKKRPGQGWRPGNVHSLMTPHGIVDMANASVKNIRAAHHAAAKHGPVRLVQHNIWTRLLEKGVDY